MTTCHDTSSWGQADIIAPVHFRHIVVGVDGSPNSIAALRLAVGIGVRDSATVEAIYAYHPYVQAQYPFALVVPPYGPAGEGRREAFASTTAVLEPDTDARAALEEAVRKAFGPEPVENLLLRPVEGNPHDVLTRFAATADLLVVGASGHSGALGLLLGSTAQACARHATCAVLVVPARHEVKPQSEQIRQPVTAR